MNTAKEVTPPESDLEAQAEFSREPRSRLWIRLAPAVRWLHIYGSLFGLAVVLFFSITGFTLNHPDWSFGSAEKRSESKGKVNLDWVKTRESTAALSSSGAAVQDSLSKFEIVEYLRKEHQIHGAVEEFRVDDRECMVSFKSAGFSADAFINRQNGEYQLSVIRQGWVAVVNDLHKGRHTGRVWSAVIDVTAALMTFISLSGLLLLLYLKRRRIPGLLVTGFGTALAVAIVWLLVP